MKKGEIYEGMIETIEFPNKGIVWVKDESVGETVRVIVKNGMPGQKVRFQRCSKNQRGKYGSRCAMSFRPAAAACIRQWRIKISCL